MFLFAIRKFKYLFVWALGFKKPRFKESKLLKGARALIEAVKSKKLSTRYSHDNIVDVERGSYAVDCTGFLSTVLISEKLQNALQEIKEFIEKTENIPKPKMALQPYPLHYVLFLQSNHSKKYWQSVHDARLLEPGDIVAYTPMNHNNSTSDVGQHVMIVSEKIKSSSHQSWISVPIFDSTQKLHGKGDLRGERDLTGKNLGGIGQAEIMLEIDTMGKPSQIKWYPESQRPMRRNITMARVIEEAC